MAITITATHALSVIQKGNGIAKVIRSEAHSTRNIEHFTKKIEQPGTYRPVISQSYGPFYQTIHRELKFNHTSQKFELRAVNQYRGKHKKTPYTKKTSATLLPKDGFIHLFKHGLPGERIGVLCDLEQVKLKPEYVFEHNPKLVTKTRPWLKHDSLVLTPHDIPPAPVPLETLKASLAASRQKGHTPKANEIMPCLQKKALIGIFCADDTLAARLAALAFQAHIYDRLNIVLPIFIMTPYINYTYTQEAIARDWEIAQSFLKEHRLYPYVERIRRSYTQILPHMETRSFFSENTTPITGMGSVNDFNLIREAAKSSALFEKHSEMIERVCCKYFNSPKNLCDILNMSIKENGHITLFAEMLLNKINFTGLSSLETSALMVEFLLSSNIDIAHPALSMFIGIRPTIPITVYKDVRHDDDSDVGYHYEAEEHGTFKLGTLILIAIYRPHAIDTLEMTLPEIKQALKDLQALAKINSNKKGKKPYMIWSKNELGSIPPKPSMLKTAKNVLEDALRAHLAKIEKRAKPVEMSTTPIRDWLLGKTKQMPTEPDEMFAL